jgi:ABC-type glycerol-3-phosphate transport system permease component
MNDTVPDIGKKMIRRYVIGIIAIVVIAVVGFPLLWMALSSLKPSTEFFTSPPTIFPQNISFEWYLNAFSNATVVQYFINSFIVASGTTIIVIIMATLGAYSLTRFHYRGRKAITMAVLSAYCIPPIMLLIPLYRIVASLHQNDSLFGVIIGHTTVTFPFAIWLLISFFRNIPREIDEAALINGASDFVVFSQIIMPLSLPGVLSTGILVFILSWNEYLLSSVLISQDSMKTLTVGLANYISSTEINWGVLMALGTATTVPIVLMFTAIQKYFIEGMTAGAVKG